MCSTNKVKHKSLKPKVATFSEYLAYSITKLVFHKVKKWEQHGGNYQTLNMIGKRKQAYAQIRSKESEECCSFLSPCWIDNWISIKDYKSLRIIWTKTMKVSSKHILIMHNWFNHNFMNTIGDETYIMH